MTVRERNVQTGWTWLTWSSQSQKNKISRYQDTESVVCKWHCQYEIENNECVISDYEVSQMMLRGWVELRSLMALGKKLLLSLSVFAIRLRKRLPDGSRSEKTVTRVIWVFGDFDSSASAAFEVDVLQRGESRPRDTLS